MRHLVPTTGTNKILHMENYKNLTGIFNAYEVTLRGYKKPRRDFMTKSIDRS